MAGAAVGFLTGAALVVSGSVGAVAAPGRSPHSASPADAVLDPALGSVLDALPQRSSTRVVVTLRDQADLTAMPPLPHTERSAVVVRTLRARATASQASLRARLAVLSAQGQVSGATPLWVTNAVSVTATAGTVRELAARPDVASVTPDAVTVTPAAAPAEPNIAAVGAPDLWALGATGQGVVVATLDSGVDTSNPDLAARWRGGSNSWFDPYGQHPASPTDLTGHGTATTGVIVGGEDPGTSYGMAPGATWVAARIFDDRGATSLTAIHQAFQWVLDPDGDPATDDAPDVVNGSWVLGSGPSCDLSLQPDVQALRASGVLPVFAAGNFGPNASTSASPANYPESFSVGAVDINDAVWGYSSSGPSSCGGRTRVFPDLVAPGVGILAADRYGSYQYLSGTSIAAPHVAGALALLLAGHPGLDVTRQESSLTASARDLGPAGPDPRYGYGRLDVAAADTWLSAAPDLSISAAPATASTMAGGSVAYAVSASPTGGYDAATSLTLSGLDPAAASWSFAPSVLGPGAWDSTLVVSTTSSLAAGTYPLTVTATGGGLIRAVQVTLGVTSAGDFSLTTSPSKLNVKSGKSGSATVSVGSVDGFSGDVALSVSGLPAGATASWSATQVTAPGAATLTIAVGSSVKRGSYLLTVTGTSGGLVRTSTTTLGVK
jgi:subtilisin family serine protease